MYSDDKFKHADSCSCALVRGRENNLSERVVLGHEAADHFRQGYGNSAETLREGCQQLLGFLEPLLSSSVEGQTQEIGRRY